MAERNTITIISERKIVANNLTKQIKSCKPLPITIYDIFWYKPVDIERLLTKKSDAIKAAEKAYVIGCRMTHILCKKFWLYP